MSQIEDLKVDVTHGLTDEEVTRSRAEHGTNRLTKLHQKSVLDFVKEALSDKILQVLIICAAIKLGVGFLDGDFVDGIAILVAVVLVTLVGVLNQIRAEKDYSALDEVAAQVNIRVIRNGRVAEILSDDLVVGDIVEINTGDVVPADLTYARGADLLVNEAHITGEPDTYKSVDDTLFGSSRILDGSGRGIAMTVGDATMFGKIRQEIGERDKTTPLEERLDDLAGKIGTAGKWAAILTFVALLGSAIVRGDVTIGLNAAFGEALLDAVTIAITIVVVAVPEGLPLAVTLSLAYTTRKMAADQALVRELSACETMGAATIACSDKTGTLTAGEMSLYSASLFGRDWGLNELGSLKTEVVDGPYASNLPVLFEGIAVNSSADLVEEAGELVVAGNSTEGALLTWLESQGVEYQTMRDRAEIVYRREFNSARKHMLTALAIPEGLRVHMKGAPEIVLEHSTHALGPKGQIVPLDGQVTEILASVREHAGRGNRTLALATALHPRGTSDEDADRGLTFLGLFVIADPIRAEVPDAVARSRKAGVRVMMITGDIRETGAEVARNAGILDQGGLVLDGAEFRALSDQEATAQLGNIAVLARALPDDKKRMVELLQADGEVVAVTGDGVNDAPALVAADVGFSMGSGSKVAREASDIVLVDDNFASLVRAIRWGRSVFENIRKFLQFQLTVNVVALGTAFVAALAGYGTPLTPVQLLWVNLIMDSLAALALALEPPTDELFAQPPHGRSEPLISRTMWTNILAVGGYMFVLLLAVLVFADALLGNPTDVYRNTFLFNTFVWLQIFNEINCRSVRFHRNPFRHVFGSRSFLTIFALIVVLQVLIVEFGGSVFSTTPLSARDWGLSILLGATALPVGALVRAIGRAVTAGARSSVPVAGS